MTLASNLIRPTWACVHFVSMEDSRSIEAGLRSANIRMFQIDGGLIATQDDLFVMLTKEMSFPDYFGMNWDALDECLRDMSWVPANGYVLICTNAAHLWKRVPLVAGDLIESWLFAGEEWSKVEKSFHLVFMW